MRGLKITGNNPENKPLKVNFKNPNGKIDMKAYNKALKIWMARSTAAKLGFGDGKNIGSAHSQSGKVVRNSKTNTY